MPVDLLIHIKHGIAYKTAILSPFTDPALSTLICVVSRLFWFLVPWKGAQMFRRAKTHDLRNLGNISSNSYIVNTAQRMLQERAPVNTNPEKTLCCFCQALFSSCLSQGVFTVSASILAWFSCLPPLSTTSTCLCTSARAARATATPCWSVWTSDRSTTNSQRRKAASRSCSPRARRTLSTWSSSGWADKHYCLVFFFLSRV